MEKKNIIPDKISYRRKDVVSITRLSAQVLDFWEEEFGIRPVMVNADGEKFYSRQQLEKIMQIKELLVLKRKSRDEVKSMLAEGQPARAEDQKKRSLERNATLRQVLAELRQILTLLIKNDNK